MRNSVFDFDQLNRRLFKANAFAGILSVHHIVYKKNKIYFAQEIGGQLQEKTFFTKEENKCRQKSHLYSHRIKSNQARKKTLLKRQNFLPDVCRDYYANL